MSEYKRLTSGNFNGAQCEYYDYYIDGCRIGNFILKCKECAHKERYDRLKEFEDKKENGQLVELPCKVGDTVYRIISVNESMLIDTAKCNGFKITQKGITPTSEITKFPIYLVGTFLTQEEAEARLKELQEGKK